METTNLLGIDDQTMVERIFAEKPHGGSTTLAVYDRFSTLGFSRLRKSARFAPLSDFEKREAAYDAAGSFLTAILSGTYQPMENVASEAYYWTICFRRAIDALRKLTVQNRKTTEEEEYRDEEYQISMKASYARRESLDDDLQIPLGQAEQITSWLDIQLIWDTIRRHLPKHCYEILVETIQKDRSQKEITRTKDYAEGSLKVMKNKCLTQLRALLRQEF